MRIIADLHIHSKYSRACSPQLEPKAIAQWCEKKGIGLVGTGDFLHPKWRAELKNLLEETRPGLYQITPSGPPLPKGEKIGVTPGVRFLLSAEISSIYKQGEKVRRVHNIIFAPNFAAVDKLILALEKRGANLKSDGRPITGIKCADLVKICKEADARMEIIPAHAWTPHFGVFGSLSGFDSLQEAFGDQAKYIFAIETGLSSDPKMNWQISNLDNISLISNSDPHSLHRLGREANVFDIEPDKLSYDEIIRVIRGKNPKEFLFTIEFFPEEGRYHLDGHADCKFSCRPEKSKELKGICPKCGKKLLLGVLNRVEALANRKSGSRPERAIPYKNLIPLEEVIAEAFGAGVGTKKVQDMYERMVNNAPSSIMSSGPNGRPSLNPSTTLGTGLRGGERSEGELYGEFAILLEMPEADIAEISTPQIAESITRVRNGQVHIEGGYDGQYGKIRIFSEAEREKFLAKQKQAALF